MTSSIHDIPGQHQETYQIDSHAALTATELFFCFIAPFKCKVRSVDLIWDAAISGTDTDSTNVNLLDADADGAGTTELANVDYALGTDAVAGATLNLYAPATYLPLAAGEKLALQLEKVGDGLLLPTGLCITRYEAA